MSSREWSFSVRQTTSSSFSCNDDGDGEDGDGGGDGERVGVLIGWYDDIC